VIITIDGPAGSGKSTAARKLAARLELAYLDTGAMYRAIACSALRRGVDLSDGSALQQLAEKIELSLSCGPTHTRVGVDGHDVSEAIRTLAVSAATSFVARQPDIRRLLVARQKQIGQELGSFVSEGRDQGSVVFPNAEFKFVLIADVERRALRRQQEIATEGEEVTFEDVLENLKSRDAEDSKHWHPLLTNGQAKVIDTSHLSLTEVVEQMIRTIQPSAGRD
jgi:cytidylate kinase